MTLFLIPARAGSKRLKNKNRLPFCGLPLWMWSYATAMRVKSEGDVIVVSTNDQEILEMAKCLACDSEFRPEHLCQDDSTTESLIDWIFKWYPEQDSICLLQATSPTRSDTLVRVLAKYTNEAFQVRSVTDGLPNGQCYLYRRNGGPWVGLPTDKGHDIDTAEDFAAAERDMLKGLP
jgi:N-acylneuraminate cytidylyltransferase